MSYDKESLKKSWSYSQARKLAECPRKYYYNYVLDKKEYVGAAAQFSSQVIHPTIAGMYGGADSAVVERLHLEFLRDNGELLDLDARFSLATARKIMQQYHKQIGFNTPELTWVSSEPRLEVALGEATVIVKPDVVFQDASGRQIPLDIKVSQYERHGVDFDAQFIGQTVACNADRYLVDEITVSKSGKVSISRQEVLVSEEHKQEWLEEMAVMIVQRSGMLRSGVWPKHTWSCWNYGKQCQFLDACQTGRAYGGELI